MRFARRSGRLFLEALQEAYAISGCADAEMPSSRKGVYYGECLNLFSDEEHRKEIFGACRDVAGEFRGEVLMNEVVDHWSAVEVLQNVPNVPCFLGAKLTSSSGLSETFLAGCASGLKALRDAFTQKGK